MTPQVKEADEQTANQVQKHFQLMAGVGCSKADFPKSPTHLDLENMPKLTVGYKMAPLGQGVPSLIRQDQLQPTWKLQEMEHEALGMLQYCQRRLQQYGLPYIGLSIAKGDIKAEDWNWRVLASFTDTFNRAYSYQEYHAVDHNPQFIMKLMQAHIQYCLKDQRRDRQQRRRLQLAKQRQEMCKMDDTLPFARFGGLFKGKRLCSSDKSNKDVLNKDRVRHTPACCSSLALSLVENIDKKYHRMRQEEFLGQSGRKPARLSQWPAGLPKDCYSDVWLHLLDRKDLESL
ncbi:hypothetical protein DFH28DRAFT_1082163 [Melampsora americana]|nr:hypothetical protein DFH28DRAFT_1082163 [Melampsora americana]